LCYILNKKVLFYNRIQKEKWQQEITCTGTNTIGGNVVKETCTDKVTPPEEKKNERMYN
jgi:hypothetical protein